MRSGLGLGMGAEHGRPAVGGVPARALTLSGDPLTLEVVLLILSTFPANGMTLDVVPLKLGIVQLIMSDFLANGIVLIDDPITLDGQMLKLG